jgi:dTDP-4-amino-4,6-dideoxygalactose transaminase
VSPESEPRPVPALDLKAQYRTIKNEIDEAIRNVVENQMFVLGPEVSGLESDIARYCQTPHAVGCASGSDALLLPLMGWGVGPGDEVITTPYTFFATAGSIWRLGAKPVFVDIDPVTFNIEPDAIEVAITSRTKAIVPVHLYGQAADMDPIQALARRRGLKVLEDAAQAIGAGYQGRRAGALGDAAAFSFYPSKNLGGYGDGGMITTADESLARQIARLRVHGMEPRYHHHEVGFNSRLDALQATVLRIKLKHLPAWTEARRTVAERYNRLIRDFKLTDVVTGPSEQPGFYHVYNQYVVRVPEADRDALRTHMTQRKIGTEIYYPIPLHLQVCFAALGHQPGDFPHSERAARETLALPIYPELTEDAQATVIGTIADYFGRSAREVARGIPRPHIFRAPEGTPVVRRD